MKVDKKVILYNNDDKNGRKQYKTTYRMAR